MALEYVGGASAAGTSTGYTVSLTGLTGGLASAPAEGDIVVVFSAFGNTASSAPAVSGNSSGAYQGATAAQHVNDTWDTEFRSFWQKMGATPDTSLTITRATNTAYGGATTVQVWRGADSASPFIGAATPASGGNTSLINPPAYDPAVTGAIIIAGGAGTQATTGAAFTGFTGMANFLTRKGDGSTADIDVAMASYAYAGSSYDPPVVSGGTGGNASSSWAGVTLALRPYVAPTLSVNDGGHGHTAGTPSTSTDTALSAADGVHAHAADQPTLEANSAADLVIAEAAHAHSAESPTLIAVSSETLAPAKATHGHAADVPALSTDSLLNIAEATHAHSAETIALSSQHSLSVSKATHSQQAGAPMLSTTTDLAPDAVAHAHLADSPSPSTDVLLVLADAGHGHLAEGLTLDISEATALTIADAASAHLADMPALSADSVLAVADALHAMVADALTLETSSAPALLIARGTHAQSAETIDLSSDTLLDLASAVHAHLADGIDLGIAQTLAILEAWHAHSAAGLVLNFEDPVVLPRPRRLPDPPPRPDALSTQARAVQTSARRPATVDFPTRRPASLSRMHR